MVCASASAELEPLVFGQPLILGNTDQQRVDLAAGGMAALRGVGGSQRFRQLEDLPFDPDRVFPWPPPSYSRPGIGQQLVILEHRGASHQRARIVGIGGQQFAERRLRRSGGRPLLRRYQLGVLAILAACHAHAVVLLAGDRHPDNLRQKTEASGFGVDHLARPALSFARGRTAGRPRASACEVFVGQ